VACEVRVVVVEEVRQGFDDVKELDVIDELAVRILNKIPVVVEAEPVRGALV